MITIARIQGLWSYVAVAAGCLFVFAAPMALPQEAQEEDANKIADRMLEKRWDRHALEHLIAVLESKSSNDEVRATATELLKAERFSPAVDRLLGALQDNNWRVRVAAAGILGDITAQIRDELREGMLPPMVEAYKEEFPEEVRDAIEQRWQEVLRGMLEEIEKKAPPALITALQDPHRQVRVRAADALGEIGAKSAAAPLIEALREEDNELVRTAAIALGGIRDKAAVPALIHLLGDKRKDVQTAAAQGLAGIGAEAIPALINTLNEENWQTRRIAENLLSRIGDYTALDGLTQALKVENWRTRVAAARALGDIGDCLIRDRKRRNAIPSLLEAATPKLSDLAEDDAERKKSATERNEATETVKRISIKLREKVLPALVQALGDPVCEVRAEAATALGKIGSREPAAGLVLALKHESDVLREAAEEVRKTQENANSASANALNDLLARPDPEPEVRACAALALGSIGYPSSIAVLVNALTDRASAVRDAAQRALDQIRSD